MGLTIHYKLLTHRRLTLADVKKITVALHAKAVALEFADVGEPMEVGPDYPGIYHIPPGCKRTSEVLPPLEGWVFHATPGDGSESVKLGLCRFAGVRGWRLHGFCKTQYASHHGWEHFLKCHRGVIELLRQAEKFGLRVKVEDEGELWKTGSPARLRRKLEEYDGAVAAFGGALKDALGDKVEGPIFQHPGFEHLEAAGAAAHGGQVAQAARLVKRFA